MRFCRLALLFSVLPAAVLACSNNASDPPGNDAGQVDSPIVGCQSDPRDDTYAPNLTKPGKAGLFQFVLVSATPGPPALDNNTWILKVLDAGGNPVQGVSLASITPFMPDHGHGTSATPQATPNGDGTFTIKPLYLYMAGLWQITIVAQAGTQKDSAVLSFCIAG